ATSRRAPSALGGCSKSSTLPKSEHTFGHASPLSTKLGTIARQRWIVWVAPSPSWGAAAEDGARQRDALGVDAPLEESSHAAARARDRGTRTDRATVHRVLSGH